MKRLTLTFALLTSLASPALAYPTGAEVPTLTWPEPVTSQSCADPATLGTANCTTR